MIEATLRVWLTAPMDEEADAAINAMSEAATKLGATVVLVEQSRRKVDQ